MIGSVLRIDTAASRASFARVARVDRDHRDARALRLVGKEGAQLSERPVAQAGALGAAGRNLSADMRQFFNCDPASSAFGVQHDSLRYAVIFGGLEPRLLAGEFDETALGGLSADALKPLAALGEPGADALDGGAGVDLAVASGGDVDDPHVNAEPIGRLELRRLGNVARRGEHPFAAHEAQIDLSLAEGEQGALMLAGNELEPHPAFEGPDRDLRRRL